MAGNSKDKLAWWQQFQGSPYPAYVTCIHPKVFGMTLNNGMQQVSELAVDDILYLREDSDQWAPSTFTLRKGVSVFVLPPDADSACKQIVSQPWMVRINRMWFKGSPTTRTPKTDSKTDNYKRIIKWEQQQLRDMRISVEHFRLEMTYFYRLSDLVAESAFEGEGQAARNRQTMCQGLVRLGIVETINAAEELISKRNTGTSRASRLLNKFVTFSTHEAKVSPSGGSGSDSSGSDEGSKEEEGEDEEGEEGEGQADTPIPMESVMGTFKVNFLSASQGPPYMPAAVAQQAEQRQTRTHKRAALLEEIKQQHRELPSGFLCSLIYIKQTGQLLALEDWATGKAGADLQEDWAKHSRQETKQLLQQTQQELADLRKQRELQLAGRRASGLHTLADAAGAAAAAAANDDDGDDADDAQYVSISDGDAAAAGQQEPGSPTQQQHSHQVAAPLRQPQRKTPRKSQNPRMAQTQQQQSKSKPQRRRLRPAAAAGDGDDAPDDDPMVLLDGSDIEPEPDLVDSEGQQDDKQQQQQQQRRRRQRQRQRQAEEEKKRRAAAAQERGGSLGTEDEVEGDSSEEGETDPGAAGNCAENGQAGGSEADADSSNSSSEEESSSSESEGSDEDSQEAAAAAAAGAKSSKGVAADGKRAAAAAKPQNRRPGRPPKKAAAAAAANARSNRSTKGRMKTSKGAVLRNGK